MAFTSIDLDNNATQVVQYINSNFGSAETRLTALEQSGGGSTVTTGERHLNILILGNSYSCDAWSYVPFLLKEYGITCTLGIYYVAGQPISSMKAYYFTPCDKASIAKSFFYIDTRIHTKWQTVIGQDDVCTHLCVVYNSVPWDIIAIQQSHTTSAVSSNYGDVITDLIKLLIDDMTATTNKAFLFGFSINHIHSGQTDAYYDATLSNIKTACEMYPFDMVFPCGTAIMDAQLNPTLSVLANNLLSADGVHLNEGLPCYCAALANVEAIFRKFYPHKSILGDISRPTSTWLSGKGIPGPQGSSVGLSGDDAETNAYIAQEMAILANDYPFQRKGYNCNINLELTNCTWSGGTSVAYKAYINKPATANEGYVMTSLKWRRASENIWHESNIFKSKDNSKWYLQLYLTEDIYVVAVAELSE